jgi:hypothetical protein
MIVTKNEDLYLIVTKIDVLHILVTKIINLCTFIVL